MTAPTLDNPRSPVVLAELFAEVVTAKDGCLDGTDTHQSWTTDNDA